MSISYHIYGNIEHGL